MDGPMERPHMGLIDDMMCSPSWVVWLAFQPRWIWGEVGMPRYRRVAYPGQHQCRACYMIFDDFKILKSCMYFFKKHIYIYCLKEHWWSLVSPWLGVARECLGQPDMF